MEEIVMVKKVKEPVQKPALTFDKDLFKRSVLYNVKTLYRKTLEEASQQQIFQAVAYAIKDAVVDNWLNSPVSYTHLRAHETF